MGNTTSPTTSYNIGGLQHCQEDMVRVVLLLFNVLPSKHTLFHLFSFVFLISWCDVMATTVVSQSRLFESFPAVLVSAALRLHVIPKLARQTVMFTANLRRRERRLSSPRGAWRTRRLRSRSGFLL